MKPTLVPPYERPRGNFVCPWCGRTFTFRYPESAKAAGKGMGDSLEDHWERQKRCGRNRQVNDPSQQKNTPFGQEVIYPGETQLARVREHEERRLREPE